MKGIQQIFRLSLFASVCAMVASCATIDPADCDAQVDQGTVSKFVCGQGGYQDQTDALNVELSDVKAVNADLEKVYEALEKERKEVRDELAKGESEYLQLSNAMKKLLNTLHEQDAENVELQAKLDQLKSSLDEVNQTDGNESVIQKTNQLNTLKNELHLLEAELGLMDI